MPINYVALKSELLNDPRGYGYAAAGGADNTKAVADLLNETRPEIQVDVSEVRNVEAQKAVIGSEFVALTDIAQRGWLAIMCLEMIPVKDPNIRGQIATIWGAGTTTRANLINLQSRNASRGEELFGEGASISHGDVSAAYRTEEIADG